MKEIKIDKSLMRVKGNNRIKTSSLFYEEPSPFEEVVFHKGEYHREIKGRTIYSFKRLFMDYGDPSGVLFAIEYLDCIEQWDRIHNNAILKPFIDKCIDNLERRIAAEALLDMRTTAENGSFQAQKYFTERGYKIGKVGRPSKKDKDANAAYDEQLKQDYADILDGGSIQ